MAQIKVSAMRENVARHPDVELALRREAWS